ncbi:MAG: hypothetical protein M3Q68_07200, partial [Actinomycetota bacterium]|nr:hypothetical protein [Actinomycetota bacterium]
KRTELRRKAPMKSRAPSLSALLAEEERTNPEVAAAARSYDEMVRRITRRPRNTGPSKKVRALVYERDGHRCVCCGATENLTIGHRRNRGMGGSKDPATNRLSALITECWSCNSASEADPAMQERALGKGWKVRQGTDPRLVRCWVIGAGPVFLLDSGGYTANPRTARAAVAGSDRQVTA